MGDKQEKAAGRRNARNVTRCKHGVDSAAQIEASVVFFKKVEKSREWQACPPPMTQWLKLLQLQLEWEEHLAESPLPEFLHLC